MQLQNAKEKEEKLTALESMLQQTQELLEKERKDQEATVLLNEKKKLVQLKIN